MNARRHVRIFISSPGDVHEERQIAHRVIERLSRDPLLRDKADLEALMWDDPDAPIPMDATMPPQPSVNESIGKPSECEIVIVILWSRMGTPLSPEIRKPDGTPYYSGTEWEYLDAVEAAETSPDKMPFVALYRRDETPVFNQEDPDYEARMEQWHRVQSFFADFTNSDGSQERGVNKYKTPAQFEELLESHLRFLVKRILDRARPRLPAFPLLALAAVAVLALIVVYGVTTRGGGPPAEPTNTLAPTEFIMDGDFNIAIGGLVLPAGISEDAARAFTGIHESIYHSLTNEYTNTGVQVEQQQHGSVAIEREADVLALAMNADLVIYATVEALGNSFRYTPRFVLARRLDPDMGEIVGDHHWLQETLTLDELQVLSQAEGDRLSLKSAILTDFTRAIVNLSAGDPVAAEEPIFRAVTAAEDYRDRYSQGIPINVIYLFASTIYRINGKLDRALEFGELAAASPNYGRGLLALGHVLYVRGVRAYDRNDRATAFNDLNLARQQYEQALALPDQPLSALLPGKAYLSLGNTYQVLYQVVAPNAKQRFLDDAIAAYQSADDFLATIRSIWLQPTVNQLKVETARQLGSMFDVAGLDVEAVAAYERSLGLNEEPTVEAIISGTLESAMLQVTQTAITTPSP